MDFDQEQKGHHESDRSSVADSSSIKESSGGDFSLWNLSNTSSTSTETSLDSFDTSTCIEYTIEPGHSPLSFKLKQRNTLEREDKHTSIALADCEGMVICSNSSRCEIKEYAGISLPYQSKEYLDVITDLHTSTFLRPLEENINYNPYKVSIPKSDPLSVHINSVNSHLEEPLINDTSIPIFKNKTSEESFRESNTSAIQSSLVESKTTNATNLTKQFVEKNMCETGKGNFDCEPVTDLHMQLPPSSDILIDIPSRTLTRLSNVGNQPEALRTDTPFKNMCETGKGNFDCEPVADLHMQLPPSSDILIDIPSRTLTRSSNVGNQPEALRTDTPFKNMCETGKGNFDCEPVTDLHMQLPPSSDILIDIPSRTLTRSSNVGHQPEALRTDTPFKLKTAADYVDTIRALLTMGLENDLNIKNKEVGLDETSDKRDKSTSFLIDILTGTEAQMNKTASKKHSAGITNLTFDTSTQKGQGIIRPEHFNIDGSNLVNSSEHLAQSLQSVGETDKETFCDCRSQCVMRENTDFVLDSVRQEISECDRLVYRPNCKLPVIDTCLSFSASQETGLEIRSPLAEDGGDVGKSRAFGKAAGMLYSPKNTTTISPVPAITDCPSSIQVTNTVGENGKHQVSELDCSHSPAYEDNSNCKDSICHSPLLFSDEEDFDPEPCSSESPIVATFTIEDITKTTRFVEQRRLSQIQASLVGVFPPPSVTTIHMGVDDILRLLQENRELLSLKLTADDEKKQDELRCLREVQNYDWPEAKSCSHPGLHYNHGPVSEELEMLGLKFGQRYVGYETASTCNVWFSGGDGSGRKRSKKQGAGPSPGRRLSHLARRRKAFSKDNLLNNTGVAKSQPNALPERRQIVVENKKRDLCRTSQILHEKYPAKASGTMAHKRALFQSPDESRKNIASSKVNSGSKLKNIFNKTKSFKRALFGGPSSATKSQTVPSESAVTKPSARQVEQGASSNQRKRTCDDTRSSVQSKRRLNFIGSDVTSSSAELNVKIVNSSNTTKENVKLSRSASSSCTARLLSSAHKKKLLWAVAESLRGQGIGMSHSLFRSCAASLARVCRTFMPDEVRTGAGSTSEVMLRLADKYVAGIVKEKQEEVS